ncbi:MAG: hypothetical protein J6Q85_06335 [Clostridia bacterium]|nr:hypothetical protein [Clostridia bacterium]
MIKTEIKLKIEYNDSDIISAVLDRIPIKREQIKDLIIVRRALNVKSKQDIHYDVSVAISAHEEVEKRLLNLKNHVKPFDEEHISIPKSTLKSRPVIVGFGPAGLFAALALAEAGARPIVYERGLEVDERVKRVKLFNTLGILDTECNVQFGEGGAGTYSDGKLKYGSLDGYKRWILERLIENGAPPEIIYSTSAHVGTDKLSLIVKRIRERIISLGGEVVFGARLVDLFIKNGKIIGGRVEKNGDFVDFSAEKLILATGHSARDVYRLLRDKGATLTPKQFGIGVRIEHPREYIDNLVYGAPAPERLGAASYHLVTHLSSGRSVYSFCMCPGGEVVAASSEDGGVVTNGMSLHARNGENSNAALLVSVSPSDFGDDAMLGIALQERIEREAFVRAGSAYMAPAERLSDFLSNSPVTSFGSVGATYPRGCVAMSMDYVLPSFITDSLREGLSDFDAWLPGYIFPDALLTAPETRSTSPVRVERGDTFSANGIDGLYPVGEGAGYSGGIISSARDGLMCALSLLK